MSALLSSLRRLPAAQRQRALRTAGVVAVGLALAAAVGMELVRASEREWLRTAPAGELLREARRSPENASLHYTAAFRLWRQGRAEEAVPLARRAVALAPDNATNQLLLGFLLAETGHPGQALRQYLRACRLAPRLHEAHSAAGQLYTEARLPEEALHHLELAWNPRRPDPSLRMTQIEALIQKGDFQEAERLCRDTLQYAPPNSFPAINVLVRALRAQGRTAEARRALHEQMRRYYFSVAPDFYAELACLILEDAAGEDRLADAEKAARRAFQSDASAARSQEAMGFLKLRQGRPAEALPYLRKAVELDPKSGRARTLLVRALRSLGREAEARSYLPPEPSPAALAALTPLQERLAANSADARTRLELAFGLEKAGDLAAAFRTCWPLVDRSRPDPAAVELADRLLLSLMNRPVYV